MEYSITLRHTLCRTFTLGALASRPVARLHCELFYLPVGQPGKGVECYVTSSIPYPLYSVPNVWKTFSWLLGSNSLYARWAYVKNVGICLLRTFYASVAMFCVSIMSASVLILSPKNKKSENNDLIQIPPHPRHVIRKTLWHRNQSQARCFLFDQKELKVTCNIYTLFPGPGCKQKNKKASPSIRCCLCAQWFHEKCLKLNENDTVGVWPCPNCRDMAQYIKRADTNISALTTAVLELSNALAASKLQQE